MYQKTTLGQFLKARFDDVLWNAPLLGQIPSAGGLQLVQVCLGALPQLLYLLG